MKKSFFAAIAAASLLLCGCAGIPGLPAVGGAPPAPLAGTVIDDQAVNFALEAFDFALTLVDFRLDAGKITPGSPSARALAAKIRAVSRFLGAADAAQKAGQASSYAEAFENARKALEEFKGSIDDFGAVSLRDTLDLKRAAAVDADAFAGWQAKAAKLAAQLEA